MQKSLVQVGAPLQPVQTTLRQFLQTTLMLVPVGVLVAALGGWWMARRAIQPLQVVSAAARGIGISELHRRLPVRGAGDELDHLAEAFNDTFAKLQDAVEQMKQFTASISHELRTPLTALRGEAEVALLEARSPEDYRRVLADQLEEFDKLTQMVNQLLILARAEAGEIQLSFEAVNLSALGAFLVEQMEPVAAAREIALQCDAGTRVTVRADRSWLERAVLNLLDNAIKFTPQRGGVEVNLKQENQHARLDVRDTGVGSPAEALPHIFERFYRADPARSGQVQGAGLGLSLVKWIIEQHHGRVEVKSRPGQGSCFTVWLALAPPDQPPSS